MMTNYDLNVWDWQGYESSYDDEPSWRIDVYECDENWNHATDPAQIIYLNKTQADMLTLGKWTTEGGDYDGANDFWIDPKHFLKTYQYVPRKVRRYLEKLEAA